MILGVLCSIWLPQREIIGRDLSVVVASCKLPTMASLALIFLTLEKGEATTAALDGRKTAAPSGCVCWALSHSSS